MVLENKEKLMEYIRTTPPDAFVRYPGTLTLAFKRERRGLDIPLTLWSSPPERFSSVGIDTPKLAGMMKEISICPFPMEFPTIYRGGRVR